MTEKKAKQLGYEITRGSYVGGADDRADRWYVEYTSANAVDRRGPGFKSKKKALEAVAEFTGQQ